MQLLSTLFSRRSRTRTVVHAGPLLLRRSGGEGSLRRYLCVPRTREVILVHHGQEPLRELARETGVTEIEVDAPARQEADATTEMALELGADRLDFTIDEPGVPGSDGTPLRRLGLREAEAVARDPNVRPRVRAKLRAGVTALREGLARVRIGDPAALTRGRATVLVPDTTAPRASGLMPAVPEVPQAHAIAAAARSGSFAIANPIRSA